ncbi:MAG: thioredoxin [Microthrixaceae bacterium]|nr:thioredoxin [Microthrixaceae bacterium]MCO5318309.1 thioredoxin [Microthrixaceae bacterium]
MAQLTELTADTFSETVNGAQEAVVVDFWAEWCGPCKKIAPILEEIADEHQGKLRVTKLDVEAHPSVAQQYGVMAIPTLIVFKDGQEVVRVTGSKGKAQLLDDFAPVL